MFKQINYYARIMIALTSVGCLLGIVMVMTASPGQCSVLPCPVGCRCSPPFTGSDDNLGDVLTVQCPGRPTNGAGEGKFLTALDEYLAQLPNLTSLSINNSSLTKLPSAVCRLRRLRHLNLDNNSLDKLPDGCLRRMTNLEDFRAASNRLVVVGDGTFSGLHRLRNISVADNRIELFGSRELANESELRSLEEINLSNNRLTTIEPWPFIRARVGDTGERFKASLTGNARAGSSLKFTNKLRIDLNNCSYHGMKLIINLQDNNINRMTDVIRGWGLRSMNDFACLFFPINKNALKLALYGHFVCDCEEYSFIKFILNIELQQSYNFPIQPFRNQIGCSSVDNRFFQRKLGEVRLKNIICDVTHRCPPGCKCIQRPHNATFHVQCSNAGLLTTPYELPPSHQSKFKLEFSGNNGFRLEPRDYFVNTTILDVSNCGLTTISDSAWQAMAAIEEVYLDGNMLTTLPLSVQQVNSSFRHLRLYNNTWSCSCDNRWIKSYLKSVEDRLPHADEIICDTPERLRGKGLVHVNDEDFCIDPLFKLLAIIICSVGGCVAVALLSVLLVYRFRIRIHTAWNIHPFDRDECHGEDMEYDAFLSCPHEDSQVALVVLAFLESNGYKVCYHQRDFEVGETIDNNICNAIKKSKRTVCLVSNSFVKSAYSVREFEVALQRNAELNKKRLILVILEEIEENLNERDEEAVTSLKQYMKSHTYIEYKGPDYRYRLLYAMAVNGLQILMQLRTISRTMTSFS